MIILPFLTASLAAIAVTAPVPAPAPPANAATAKPAPLAFETHTLANGLRVILLEDHRAPVATVQVWYRVGSKDEPKGKSGFAHLFEHLMFKGSKNVPTEGHARYVEQLGGAYNAATSFDQTFYYETVPANALDRVLFLEADRMASLIVDEPNLKSERDVVKEEYRSRVANAPYGELIKHVLSLAYPVGHPYDHPPIGSIPDLDAATLADVKAFHDTYYKPDNATLVLVGDFVAADALKRVETYFGGIPKSATGNFPRIALPTETTNGAKQQTFYDKLAPLPAVGVAYRVPAPNDPDAPVFNVITQILSSGASARLYRSLVRDQELALQAQGGGFDLLNGGMFFFFAIANGGKDSNAVATALLTEVDKLRAEPVSDAELAKAKNQLLTSEVFGRIGTESKASALASADLLYGSANEVNERYDKLVAVMAADVRRVASKYFAPERRNEFSVLPASMDPKAKK
ncbi:MAG: insulinase family protein [Armatimonadetes bacterium]|nr:insulinase family protein [Armatimonadota bacterium]